MTPEPVLSCFVVGFVANRRSAVETETKRRGLAWRKTGSYKGDKMIKFSAFADEIGDDLQLQMDVCQANGVRCIDVRGIDGKNVSKMTLAEVAQYKTQMSDRGFSVPCVGSPIGKISIDDDFEEHLDLLKHCCDVAKAFDTDRIRIFSFYPSKGRQICDQREEVMERMSRMVEVAEATEVTLLHENESAIYGETVEGVKDLFETIQSKRLEGIFDPANFVVAGIAPYDDAWTQGLAELTDYFHIKDKRPEDKACVPAGEGAGQVREILADAKARQWSGYMTLEPHMAAAGQFSGFSGPELFSKAAAGLKRLCDEVGLEHE